MTIRELDWSAFYELVGDVKDFYPVNEVPEGLAMSIARMRVAMFAVNDSYEVLCVDVARRFAEAKHDAAKAEAEAESDVQAADVECPHKGFVSQEPDGTWVCTRCWDPFRPTEAQKAKYFGGHRG